jgi:hypothetical protein
MPLLTDGATSAIGIKVVPDSNGRAHVLASLHNPELKQVIDITVGPDGVMERQIIRPNAAPRTVDGAFDARGRLHVLLDDEHAYLEDGVWHSAAPTPWSKEGLKVSEPAFVRGAPDLIWKFRASGKDIGAASGRWSPIFIGGGMGALIIPWHFQTSKVVLVAETSAGYGPWNVLSPESTNEATLFDLAADKKGSVHLLYSLDGVLVWQESYGIANAQEMELTGINSSAPTKNKGTNFPIVGIPEVRNWPFDMPPRLAIDSESGSILFWPSWFVSGDKWMKAGRGPFQSLGRLAWAGSSSFHAIGWSDRQGQYLYAMYSDFEWSAPMELGAGRPFENFVGRRWVRNMTMASNGEGKALVVWQRDDGVFGRWIERVR